MRRRPSSSTGPPSETGLRVCFGCDDGKPDPRRGHGGSRRDRPDPGDGVPRRARRAVGTVPGLPRPGMFRGVLRPLEEPEREVVLDVLVREQGQGPGVPRAAGGPMTRQMTTLELDLRAPGGEPVDLWRTLISHGFAGLSPTVLDEEHRSLAFTIRVPGGRPRRVRVSEDPGTADEEAARGWTSSAHGPARRSSGRSSRPRRTSCGSIRTSRPSTSGPATIPIWRGRHVAPAGCSAPPRCSRTS